jgi:lambda repressor-like predicted transcriptional regulator
LLADGLLPRRQTFDVGVDRGSELFPAADRPFVELRIQPGICDPPSVVKSNQGRYGSSSSINDPKTARLIADILRTDHGRWYPWHPDHLLTRQMRAKASLILHLTKLATRISDRLRAVLLRYYPTALEIFKDGLGTQIALYWIQTYTNPQAARQLDLEAFAAVTQKYHDLHRWVAGAYARLKANYPETSLEA